MSDIWAEMAATAKFGAPRGRLWGVEPGTHESGCLMKIVLMLALLVAVWWRIALGGFDMSSAEDRGFALLQAASMGDEQGARRALSAGTPIDFRDNSGNTALTYACCAGRCELVRYLLERGANSNSEGLLRHTPLMAAMNSGDPALL